MPNEVEGAASDLTSFIADSALQASIKEHLSLHHYGNEQEALKIDAL